MERYIENALSLVTKVIKQELILLYFCFEQKAY